MCLILSTYIGHEAAQSWCQHLGCCHLNNVNKMLLVNNSCFIFVTEGLWFYVIKITQIICAFLYRQNILSCTTEHIILSVYLDSLHKS